MSERFRLRARRLRRDLEFLWQLRSLPRAVARFQWRARRLAASAGDEFGPVSATRPRKLATLLELAAGRRRVVELGTAAGWTAISLLLADPERELVSYDIFQRPEPARYLSLVDPGVRRRLRLVHADAGHGPQGGGRVELLYIDSSHDREETMREVRAWERALHDEAVIVFDDYDHPQYPGVREAVRELGLAGEERDGLFVHRVGEAGAGAGR